VDNKSKVSGARKRIAAIDYIRQTEALKDIVVSGGDAYYLMPDELREMGRR
jgi:L-lysine 2,3-aminomutase